MKYSFYSTKLINLLLVIALMCNVYFNWNNRYNLLFQVAIHYDDDAVISFTNDLNEKVSIMILPKSVSSCDDFFDETNYNGLMSLDNGERKSFHLRGDYSFYYDFYFIANDQITVVNGLLLSENELSNVIGAIPYKKSTDGIKNYYNYFSKKVVFEVLNDIIILALLLIAIRIFYKRNKEGFTKVLSLKNALTIFFYLVCVLILSHNCLEIIRGVTYISHLHIL